MKNYWKNFLVSFIVALLLACIFAFLNNAFEQTDAKETIRIICDSLFIPGIFFVCIGALLYCSSKGAFLSLKYLINTLFVTHNWSRTRFKDRKTYREYREEKLANPKAVPSYVLHVGVIFVAISAIFLVLYYNV